MCKQQHYAVCIVSDIFKLCTQHAYRAIKMSHTIILLLKRHVFLANQQMKLLCIQLPHHVLSLAFVTRKNP